MSARQQILWRGLAGLAALWLLVYGVILVAGSMKPTAEKVEAFQERNPLSEVEDPEKRRRIIEEMASLLNRMDASEVARLAERAEADPRRDFFRELNPEEQFYFLERRVGRAFQQMMESFNAMEREERREIVERALRQMREGEGNGRGGGPSNLEEQDPEVVERIAEAGFRAYYADASAETKIDLAPLMEEMQNVMSRHRGRPR
jgi:hypothetical protein